MNRWMKRFAAWFLAALLAVSPVLAEPAEVPEAEAAATEAAEVEIVEVEAVDAAVAEAGYADLCVDPGEGDENPGEDGENPGEDDDNPDVGGENPGEGDENPGEDGENPGEGEDNPGEDGDNPDVGGENPGEDDENPGEGDDSPGEGGENPGEGENNPGEDDENPAGGKEDKEIPAGNQADAPEDMPDDTPEDDPQQTPANEGGENPAAGDRETTEGDETPRGEGDPEGDEAQQNEENPANKENPEGEGDPEDEKAKSDDPTDAAEAREGANEANTASESNAASVASVAPSATPVPEASPPPVAAIAPAAEETPKLAEAVPGIALPGEITMGKGEKRVLTPVFTAMEATPVTWSSSKPGVVSVSAAGRLNAKRRGRAVITVTAANGLAASCSVRVARAPSRVKLKPAKQVLGVGQTVQLTAKLPKGTGSGFTWKSSRPGVAAVDAQGQVTGIAPGKARIIVRTFNGKKSVCRVTVKAAPTAVAFTDGPRTLGVGMSVDLKPFTDSGVKSGIAITSDNLGVVCVSGTNIVGMGPGTAVVTGTTYNGVSTAVTVTVVPAPSSVAFTLGQLHMGIGEKYTLTPVTEAGTAASFKFRSSRKGVATVSAKGVVKAKKRGTTTITATSHNGVKATIKVKVYKAPKKVKIKPASLALETGNSYQLKVTLSKGSASKITFSSSNPDVASVDAAGVVYANQPGTAKITARTYNKKKATCKVTVAPFSGASDAGDGPLSLSNRGMVMLRVGGSWTLTASSTTGSLKGIQWATTSTGIAKIKSSGGACTVTAVKPGTAIVSAKTPDGGYASVIFMMVDISDLSAANFNNVQKALLAHEDLVLGDAGGNVIWEMIAARLAKAGFKQDKIDALIASVKAADPLYRNLYIYSFGTYGLTGETSAASSYFDTNSNILNVRKSNNYSAANYAYVFFHESGHAIDYNAGGNHVLNSLNDDAAGILLSDVHDLLLSRVNTAIAQSNVSTGVNAEKVVTALLDYRTLLKKDAVMSDLNMSEDEKKVYDRLAGNVSSEMNSALPANNGCMVWDGVEGATNYAVSGSFGHSYLLNNGNSTGNYYYYDRQGNPTITVEPWAEFFSANIIGDATTIAANLAYLPKTCKYFAETFAPGLLNYFVSYVKSK